ncbi:MAG: hypothetical protein M3376_11530 [Actinomycetota bacterium]|nr:hypothetical protein [Actinomycetota bacterium]
MPVADGQERAGSSFERRMWADVYAELSAARREGRLGVDDLERLAVAAYGFPAELEFLQFFIGALKAVAPGVPGLPDDPPPLEFQVSDPGGPA